MNEPWPGQGKVVQYHPPAGYSPSFLSLSHLLTKARRPPSKSFFLTTKIIICQSKQSSECAQLHTDRERGARDTQHTRTAKPCSSPNCGGRYRLPHCRRRGTGRWSSRVLRYRYDPPYSHHQYRRTELREGGMLVSRHRERTGYRTRKRLPRSWVPKGLVVCRMTVWYCCRQRGLCHCGSMKELDSGENLPPQLN